MSKHDTLKKSSTAVANGLFRVFEWVGTALASASLLVALIWGVASFTTSSMQFADVEYFMLPIFLALGMVSLLLSYLARRGMRATTETRKLAENELDALKEELASVDRAIEQLDEMKAKLEVQYQAKEREHNAEKPKR